MVESGAIDSLRKYDSALWRRAIMAGVRFGPEPWLRYSPPVFGIAFGAALREKRELVRANLRRVLGPRPPLVELADTAAVFSNYASCLTEGLLLGAGRGYKLTPRSEGVEHYHACAAKGRGVIVVTAHTGGWEVAGPVLAGVHHGNVVVVMQRERDPLARALQDEARRRTGVTLVHVGESSLDALPLLRHLKQRDVVAMQIDRVPKGVRARDVELFGAPWRAPEGPLRLAAVSGAPILPVFTRRIGFMEYEAIVAPAIWVSRRPSEDELDGAARAMTLAMENVIRAYPTQWFNWA